MTIQILINATAETNMQYELIVQAYYIDINSSPASVAYTRRCIESALDNWMQHLLADSVI